MRRANHVGNEMMFFLIRNKRELYMWTKTLATVMLLFCLVGAFSSVSVFASGPGLSAGHIGSVELLQIFEQALLVDCRSRLEFDVLHMKNAVHVPVGTMVKEDLQRLRAKNSSRPLVFYCNGEECPQGRTAFGKAGKWGFQNIFFYRPGILAWATEHPEEVLFFGKTPGPDSQVQLFDREHFRAKSLSPRQFVVASRQPGAMVVDIRDVAERNSFTLTLPHLKYSSVDRLVKLIKSRSRKVMGKKIYIVDSCGMQSQWLQYILDENGMDYAFLAGGAAAWRQAALDSYGNDKYGAAQ